MEKKQINCSLKRLINCFLYEGNSITDVAHLNAFDYDYFYLTCFNVFGEEKNKKKKHKIMRQVI